MFKFRFIEQVVRGVILSDGLAGVEGSVLFAALMSRAMRCIAKMRIATGGSATLAMTQKNGQFYKLEFKG